jgi:hypothetical protein
MAGVSSAVLAELTAGERKALFVKVSMPKDEENAKQIPRFRLNPANINRVFNCDVEYLYEDATGVVVWPKNWITDCLPSPYLYLVHEKKWPLLEADAMEIDEYRGKTIVIADNCPDEATQAVMLTWLNAGIDDDDPEISLARKQLADMEKKLADVDQMIKELPTMKGEGNNAQEELDNKRKKAENLALQKSDLEAAIAKVNDRSKAIQEERLAGGSDAGIRIRLAKTKMPQKLNLWEVRFGNDERAARQSYRAVHKMNWSEFRVAVHKQTQEIIVGKGELEGLTSDFQEINMRLVTVTRRRHGIGMYKFNDERGFFSGFWRHGLRHGMGTEVNQQGRFQGNFDDDWRRGPGSQISANGDTFRGPFGGSRHHIRESLLGGDEYNDGLRHGKGRMRFVDGSIYDGSFKDGLPSGQGMYISPTGKSLQGNFCEWGCLDGVASEAINDVTNIGSFRRGLLHGRGTRIDLQLGTFDGEFKDGVMHGLGVYHSKVIGGSYVGWYNFGERWGRGILNYGNTDRDALAAEERTKKIAMSMRNRANGEDSDLIPESFWKKKTKDYVEYTLSGATGILPDLPPASTQGRYLDSYIPEEEEEEEDKDETDDDDDVDGEDENNENLESKDGKRDSGPSSGTKNSSSRVKKNGRVSEYEKVLEKPDNFLKYKGDYSYEGRWRAGSVRSGGIFISRKGRTEPHLHVLRNTSSGQNPFCPRLDDLPMIEKEVQQAREKAIALAVKETVQQRLDKQTENLSSYIYWKRLAEKRQRKVRRKTRAAKVDFYAMATDIKKPARVVEKEEGEVSDGEEDDQEVEEEEKEEEVRLDENGNPRPDSAYAEPVVGNAF